MMYLLNNSKNSFGTNLRREINRKNLKYFEAAELFDISLGFLNKLMNGTATPSLEVIYRLVEKLEVSSDALFVGDDRPVQPKPMDPVSTAQIAAALTQLNAKFDSIASTTQPSPAVAAIFDRLSAMNENQLKMVNGFVDDVLAFRPATVLASKTK